MPGDRENQHSDIIAAFVHTQNRHTLNSIVWDLDNSVTMAYVMKIHISFFIPPSSTALETKGRHWATSMSASTDDMVLSFRRRTVWWFECKCTVRVSRQLRYITFPKLVGRHKDPLLLEQFSKFSILMHRHQYIATTDELLLQIQLRNCGPVWILFDTWDLVLVDLR